MERIGVTERERSQPKSVKPKIGARKLRTCVYWQGALQHENGKQWLCIIRRRPHFKKGTVTMALRNSSSQSQSFTKPSSVKTALNGSFELQENTPRLQHKY
jgi:hypothetical protein